MIVTGEQIVQEALEQLTVLEEGQAPSTAQLSSCLMTLGMLATHLQSQGLNIYALRESFLPLIPGKTKYSALDYSGTTGLSLSTNILHTSSYALHTFEAENTSQILVSGLEFPLTWGTSALGNILGVPTTDGVSWVSNALSAVELVTLVDNVATVRVTLSDVVSDMDETRDVILLGPYSGRPIHITNASLRDWETNFERELDIIMSSDYAQLTSKNMHSEPNLVFYNRGATVGDLRLWGAPTLSTQMLVLWGQQPLSDITSTSLINSQTGFPQEFFLMLTFKLAEALSPKYSPPGPVQYEIRRLARLYTDEAWGFDTETSIDIQPDIK